MFNPNTIVFRRFSTNTANSFPLFIFIDQTGNVWFTEVTGNRIGEILYPGNVMVEYLLPTPDSGPAEVAYQNGTSLLWITESYANRIARFNMTDHTFQEFTPSQPVNSPVGVVLDRAGNVWLAQHGGSSVDVFFPSNSTLRKYSTSPPTRDTVSQLQLQLLWTRKAGFGLWSISPTGLGGWTLHPAPWMSSTFLPPDRIPCSTPWTNQVTSGSHSSRRTRSVWCLRILWVNLRTTGQSLILLRPICLRFSSLGQGLSARHISSSGGGA